MNKYKKFRLYKLIFSDIRKSLTGSTFWFAAAALVCVCFFNTVTSIDGGRNINTWYIITSMTRGEQLQNINTSFLQVAKNVIGGYVLMFAPMITGITVIPLLCDEQESGMFRFTLFRSSKQQIALGKLLSTLLCGGLVLLVGYVVFLVMIYILLPHGKDYPEEIRFFYTSAYTYEWKWLTALPEQLQYALIILRNLLGVFCYGAVSAGWTYLLSVFMTNRYLIACIPFMVVDFIERKSSALVLMDTASPLYQFLGQYVFPQSLLQIGYNLQESLMILGIYLCIEFLFWRIYFHVLERRVDCGQ